MCCQILGSVVFLNEVTRQHETIKDIGAQVFLITLMRYPALTLREPASGACDNTSDSESEVSWNAVLWHIQGCSDTLCSLTVLRTDHTC